MRRTLVIAVLLASAALPVQASEAVELSAKARSTAVASALLAKQSDAPFRTARDPLPEMLLHEEQEARGPAGGCDRNATALCYDLADRRVVYRPARRYMPQFEGLRAESVSLRRDKLVLKYSFK
jgi:hypothetical protein